MVLKICCICEKSFEAKANTKTCSSACKRKNRQEIGRKYREANPDKVLESQRKHREVNPDNVRERSRKYREANRDKAREQKRKYYEADPDKVRERSRKYREVNPDKVLEIKRKYRSRKKQVEAMQNYINLIQQGVNI